VRAPVVGSKHEHLSPLEANTTGGRCARAFTLVDVLVTMAVIGVLIAILLPSLASVRETAHQIVCRSNVRQLAIGSAMYADANSDSIPRTATIVALNGSNNQSFETMTLRFGADAVQSFQGAGWDGMGLLFSDEYLPAPKIFYCPSHRGSHPYREMIGSWQSQNLTITGNFQYRGQGPTGAVSSSGQPVMSRRLFKIRPSCSLIADGMRNQADYNHQVGANVMRADISVVWYNDSSKKVADSLPKDNEQPSESQIQDAWNDLDHPGGH
jgi:competence protein ComGC